ncbi:MAG TPA: energy transducer TonB [Gemmatimonadales bacterium]
MLPKEIDERFIKRVRLSPGVEARPARPGAPAWDAVVPLELTEQRPELLSAPPPAYPTSLRDLGVEGLLIVRVVVDTLGRVERESFSVAATPHHGLVAPVREALRRALFRPGRVGGRAVRVLVEIPFTFRIER